MEYEAVIGLEVHVQLATRSKLFSGADTTFGADPNTQACGLDIALPGMLPVLNREAVVMAVRFGLAIDAEVNCRSVFARKNYFYPDLPKGYQISQMDQPVVRQGKLHIMLDAGTSKTVGITRAHLEEDAGKSLHQDFQGMTAIDLNRAGTPLLEIVSDPDIRSAREAVIYLKKLHGIIRCLAISDGNMAEGSMRCDANVSVRPVGQRAFGTRTEIKNVNSFRFVEKAINHEIERHIDLLNRDGTSVQETRLYDAAAGVTRPMRSKEEANDYRYFPDPDLLPVVLDQRFIDQIAQQLPELPDARKNRFIQHYALKADDAEYLATDHELAAYFEAVLQAVVDTQQSDIQQSGARNGIPVSDTRGERVAAQYAVNWVLVELGARLNKDNLTIPQSQISAQQLAQLIVRIMDKTISGKIAKNLFHLLWEQGGDVDQLITQQGLQQLTDSVAIEKIVAQVIAEHQQQVEQYRAANEDKKPRMLGFFVGRVMKQTQGKANPAQVNSVLLRLLS